MKLIYIAGKFRGPTPWDVEENIRAAERLALDTWRAGAAALCPHANTRFFDKAADDQVFLDGTLEMLARCDAVRLVPGWEASRGTRGEVIEAHRLNLPVFVEGTGFRMWLQGWQHYPTLSVEEFRRRVDEHDSKHTS